MTLPEKLARDAAKEIQLATLRDGCLNGTKLVGAIEDVLRKAIEACAELADENAYDGSGDKAVARAIRALCTDEETP